MTLLECMEYILGEVEVEQNEKEISIKTAKIKDVWQKCEGFSSAKNEGFLNLLIDLKSVCSNSANCKQVSQGHFFKIQQNVNAKYAAVLPHEL